MLNTERKSAFATPRIFVHRAITPVYTPWETHGARVVGSSNENIIERLDSIREGGGLLVHADDTTHSDIMMRNT